MNSAQTSRDMLRQIGIGPEHEIDVAKAALHLAALKRNRVDLAPCFAQLETLEQDVATAFTAGGDLSLTGAAATLATVLAEQHAFRGDDQTYDDLENADLISVLDRRKGLPVALGILYIHVARAQGWTAYGLNFPGHFLVALEHDGERAILDPFHEGVSRTPQDLRELLKLVAGQDAELNADMYAAVPDRAVLLRLQSNIRLRLLQMQRFSDAIEIVDSMLLFAPKQSDLWRDCGLLNAQLGNMTAAIQALESAIEHETIPARRQEAAAILEKLRRRMN